MEVVFELKYIRKIKKKPTPEKFQVSVYQTWHQARLKKTKEGARFKGRKLIALSREHSAGLLRKKPLSTFQAVGKGLHMALASISAYQIDKTKPKQKKFKTT